MIVDWIRFAKSTNILEINLRTKISDYIIIFYPIFKYNICYYINKPQARAKEKKMIINHCRYCTILFLRKVIFPHLFSNNRELSISNTQCMYNIRLPLRVLFTLFVLNFYNIYEHIMTTTVLRRFRNRRWSCSKQKKKNKN